MDFPQEFGIWSNLIIGNHFLSFRVDDWATAFVKFDFELEVFDGTLLVTIHVEYQFVELLLTFLQLKNGL